MKTIMVMVASVDAKVTQGDNPDVHTWTSIEDQTLFSSLIEKHNLIVMGRKTFEVARKHMKLIPGKRRIVLTRAPEKFQEQTVTGQLEFTSDAPQTLVDRLTEDRYTELLLVGGGEVNAAFLQDNLVDEIHLTIEPRLFGQGKPLVADVSLNVSLKLMEVKQLNNQGTLHCIYAVAK